MRFLLALLLLTGCVYHPTMTITKDGQSSKVPVKPLQPIVGPDGIQLGMDGATMDWVDVATYKSMGALPPPPRRQPVWQCLAADYGTTALGIANFGLMEANPIGWPAVIPLGIAHTVMVQRAERKGDARPAKFASWLHCAAATWNAALILAVLL